MTFQDPTITLSMLCYYLSCIGQYYTYIWYRYLWRIHLFFPYTSINLLYVEILIHCVSLRCYDVLLHGSTMYSFFWTWLFFIYTYFIYTQCTWFCGCAFLHLSMGMPASRRKISLTWFVVCKCHSNLLLSELFMVPLDNSSIDFYILYFGYQNPF